MKASTRNRRNIPVGERHLYRSKQLQGNCSRLVLNCDLLSIRHDLNSEGSLHSNMKIITTNPDLKERSSVQYKTRVYVEHRFFRNSTKGYLADFDKNLKFNVETSGPRMN